METKTAEHLDRIEAQLRLRGRCSTSRRIGHRFACSCDLCVGCNAALESLSALREHFQSITTPPDIPEWETLVRLAYADGGDGVMRIYRITAEYNRVREQIEELERQNAGSPVSPSASPDGSANREPDAECYWPDGQLKWGHPANVRHLILQLQTLDPVMAVSSVTFIDTAEGRKSRAYGLSMSRERWDAGGWLNFQMPGPLCLAIWATQPEKLVGVNAISLPNPESQKDNAAASNGLPEAAIAAMTEDYREQIAALIVERNSLSAEAIRLRYGRQLDAEFCLKRITELEKALRGCVSQHDQTCEPDQCSDDVTNRARAALSSTTPPSPVEELPSAPVQDSADPRPCDPTDADVLAWLDRNYGRERQFWYGPRTLRDAVVIAMRELKDRGWTGLRVTELAQVAEGCSSTEICECCDAPAPKKDVEGVPLCDDCYEDLKRETNAILGGGEQEPQ